MTLISVQGWSKLLYMVIESSSQPWFAESTIEAEGLVKEPYTPIGLLRDWRVFPSARTRQ